MTRLRMAGGAMALATALALAGCGDPQPGLKDEARVEKVADCKSVVRSFASTDRKREQLCECLTGRLAYQGLTIEDLSGAKQDRAMEQLRWCGQQVGVFPKINAPVTAETPSDESGAEEAKEPESDADEGEAAEVAE